MELRQLEAFAAVMSTGSVTAAGRLLGRSQPAVSRLLQDLEAEIGYPLFVRAGPRVSPTEQGFLLYEDVESAMVGLQRIRERAQEIACGDGRPLRLAATPALSAGLVPAALERLGEQGCHTHVHWRSAAPERVAHAVITGAVQLGVTSLPLEHQGVQVHWIGQAPCVAALPAADPLAALPVVPVAELATRRLITMSNPYRLRRRLDQAMGRVHRAADASGADAPGAQAGPAGLIETNSTVNALSAVRAGLGVAVLEPVTAHGLPLDGVAIRPIDVHIPFFFGAITPQAKPLSPAVQAMLDALRLAAATLTPDFRLHEPSEHAALLHSIYGDATPATDDFAP